MDGAIVTVDHDGTWQIWMPNVDDGPAYETTDPLKIEELLDSLAQQ